ncbi:MAG: hypothetical protein LGB68_05140, partial [Sulfurovum sp.]|nr:hypothetical protein [Sulfurovum sp.]
VSNILQPDVLAFTDVSLGWSGDILQLDVLAFTNVSWGWESVVSWEPKVQANSASQLFLGEWSR